MFTPHTLHLAPCTSPFPTDCFEATPVSPLPRHALSLPARRFLGEEFLSHQHHHHHYHRHCEHSSVARRSGASQRCYVTMAGEPESHPLKLKGHIVVVHSQSPKTEKMTACMISASNRANTHTHTHTRSSPPFQSLANFFNYEFYHSNLTGNCSVTLLTLYCALIFASVPLYDDRAVLCVRLIDCML